MPTEHVSYICNLENEDENIKLSYQLSEWLFTIKFWSSINAKLGTLLDQYEEEFLDSEKSSYIVLELRKLIEKLKVSQASEKNISFVRGRNENLNPIVENINLDIAIVELASLAAFIEKISKAGRSCIFSL